MADKPFKPKRGRGKRTPEEQAALEEWLARVRDEIATAVEELNADHALVLIGDKVLVLREYAGEDGRLTIGFMTPAAFRLWHAKRKFPTANGEVGLGDIWLEHPLRREYRGVTFAPGEKGRGGAPEGWYNVWTGFDVEPRAADPLEAFPTFHDHLFTNIASGDPALFEWVVGWFAHMLQKPEERIGTALVLRGRQGTGKTKVGEVIGSLISRHYVLIDDPRYIVGQFNEHMRSCLLLQADEGFWAGDKQAEGRLKGLITSRHQMIEKKGVDPVPMRNLVRLMVTSNNEWVVPAGLEERRFAVIDVADHAMQNSAYFAAIDAEMARGGREALLHWLLNFDLSRVDLRRIPATEALLEQKLATLDLVESWLFERLQSGTITERRDDWATEIAASELYRDLVRHADAIGVRRRPTPQEFAQRLQRKLPPGFDRTRPWREVTDDHGMVVMDGDKPRLRRVRCYTIPDLEACREAFEAASRQPIKWHP